MGNLLSLLHKPMNPFSPLIISRASSIAKPTNLFVSMNFLKAVCMSRSLSLKWYNFYRFFFCLKVIKNLSYKNDQLCYINHFSWFTKLLGKITAPISVLSCESKSKLVDSTVLIVFIIYIFREWHRFSSSSYAAFVLKINRWCICSF